MTALSTPLVAVPVWWEWGYVQFSSIYCSWYLVFTRHF